MRRSAAIVDDAGADPAVRLVDRVAHVLQRTGALSQHNAHRLTAAHRDAQGACTEIGGAIGNPGGRQTLRLGQGANLDGVATDHRIALRRRGRAAATDAAGHALEGFTVVESLRRRLQTAQRTFQASVGRQLGLLGLLLRGDRIQLHPLGLFQLVEQTAKVEARADAQR
ncbi:hypothetical protein D3C78_1133920 [compost metagenome]